METIRSSDGTPIATWRAGSGPALLLVHGTSSDHTTWQGVLPALAPHFTVCTMDRRGRGHSGDGPLHSLDREAEDVAALVQAIGGAVHVLGHSFGALCALEAALISPHIGRLILYEPPLPARDPTASAAAQAQLQRLIDIGEREQALLHFYREVLRLAAPELAGTQALGTWSARVAAVHTIPRELAAVDAFGLAQKPFGRIDRPTLLLMGGSSPHPWPARLDAFAAALPNSRRADLPGQGNLAMRTAPQLLANTVIDFLADRRWPLAGSPSHGRMD